VAGSTHATGNDSFYIRDESRSLNRLIIDSSGNVGIGTDDPNKILHLNSSGETIMRIVGGTSHETGFYLGDSGNGSIGQIVYHNNGNHMRFNTNGSERMRIDSSGAVGIGVTPESNWASNFDALQVGARTSIICQSDAYTYINNNNYMSDNWKYQDTAGASQYRQNEGEHSFWVAASGTADAIISFTRAMTVTSSSKVGIGESSPLCGVGGLHVKDGDSGLGSVNGNFDNFIIEGDGNTGMNILAGTSSESIIGFSDTGGHQGVIRYDHSTNRMQFSTNDVTKLSILSGGGITFGSDTADANALDDYEEGTFTVGWTSTDNTFTPDTTTGQYTKVGQLVTVTYMAYMSGAPTIGTSGNGITFTGLPFTSTSGTYYSFTWGHHRWLEFPADTNGLSLELDGGATLLSPKFRTGIGELASATALVWSRNGSGIRFTGSYFTAS